MQGAYCWDADNNQYIDYGALDSTADIDMKTTYSGLQGSVNAYMGRPRWGALPSRWALGRAAVIHLCSTSCGRSRHWRRRPAHWAARQHQHLPHPCLASSVPCFGPNPYPPAVGSWGPAIVGHANDEVSDALKAQIDKGTSFGAPCELEVGARGGGRDSERCDPTTRAI